MTLEFYSTILTIGSIAIFIGLLGISVAGLLSNAVRARLHHIPYERYLVAIAALAITATAASLTYQLVYLTPVCELCWWQRIFLYPVSVITLVALWFKTRETHVTVAVLGAFGLWYASYHYYYHFQGFVLGKTLSLPCSYGGLMPACTDSPILVFGFVTIPFMGIMVFASFLLLTALAFSVRHQKHNNYISVIKTHSNMESNQTPLDAVLDPVAVAPTEEVPTRTQSRKAYMLYGAIAFALLLVVLAFLFTRGYLVAATVNGSPISRLAVIQELEKQGGKAALEAMVNEKLIAAELAKNGITVEVSEVDAKIKEIESQISGQGGTLEAALTEQGMTLEVLREQIGSQLQLEKLLADKIVVTTDEVASYIKDNEIVPPPGVALKDVEAQVSEQLAQQKFQLEAQTWIAGITSSATIKYYTTY